MFALGFFVVHDSSTGSEDNESEEKKGNFNEQVLTS